MLPHIAQIRCRHDSRRDELLIRRPHHRQGNLSVVCRRRGVCIYILHGDGCGLMLWSGSVLAGYLLLEGLTIHHSGLEYVRPHLEEIIFEIAGQRHDIACYTSHLPLKLHPYSRAEATAHVSVLRTHAIPSAFVYAFNVNKCHVRMTSCARTEYSLIFLRNICPSSWT
ncbi:hypothetical protein SDC9_186998 [bioreactor metagenome]|uniref:Uncharacterized protein n=1 Tax=bioreactor metagenome TaxID=1076179 RepID=A0A645HL43_9ZZZZ